MGEQEDAGFWGYSSVGRAPALQAGGQEFKSPYLHLFFENCILHIVKLFNFTDIYFLRKHI